jgi:hypothetical protein
MYEIHCDECGRIGIHPSRIGAETKAEHHTDETGHDCRIEAREEV